MRVLLRLFISFILLGQDSPLIAQAPPPSVVFDLKLHKYIQKFNRFVRGYIGCPDRDTPVEYQICRPDQGVFDYKLWRELQKDSKDLFDRKEKGETK